MAVEKDNTLDDNLDKEDSKKEEIDVEVVDTQAEADQPPVENIEEQLIVKFYENLASDMDDQVLTRISSQLISD